MAFSVSKLKKSNRWRFGFYSKKMKDKGYPATKWFTFNANDYRKSDVEEIRAAWIKMYEKGEWNPWTDPKPAIHKDGEQLGVMLNDVIPVYLKQARRELADNTYKGAETYTAMLSDMFPHHRIKELKESDLTRIVNSYENYHSRRTVHYQFVRFFSWLEKKKYIDQAPAIEMFSTREERNRETRQPITHIQLTELIAAFRKIKKEKMKNKHAARSSLSRTYKRHEDMVTVLFYMGLRLADILHVRPAWILDDYRLLRIGDLKRWKLSDEYHPKSQDEHDPPIAIPQEVQGIFREYAGKCDSKYDRIFGIKSRKYFQVAVKEAAIKAFGEEFGEGFSPHNLRHSCATYWLNERRVPMQEVQRLLRHKNIKITMSYYHSNTESHYSAFNSSILKLVN